MSDFAPPSGPPPPKLPEGWKAVWNSKYSEWFFVNIYTKKSQWDKPTEAAYPAGEEAPSGPPPSANPTGASEKSQLSSNNPYAGSGPTAQLTDDEKLARKLQEEEDSKARGQPGGTRGAASDFYGQTSQQGQYGDQYGGQSGGQYGGGQQYGGYQQSTSPYPQAQAQPQYQDQGVQDKGKKGGFLGKLLGKSSSSSSQSYPNQQQGYGQQPYAQPGYGGQPGYAPQGGYYQQQQGQPPKRHGGLGTGGALALGAGAGLLGGALIGEEIADHSGDGGDGGDGGWGGDNGDFGGDGGDYGGDF